MTDIRLRRVDATDPAVWALITKMDAACFEKHEAPALSTNEGTWWIAYIGDQSVGYCNLKVREPGIGAIDRVGVLPKHRGRGLQKRMMRRAVQTAKKDGLREVVSDTANNVPSSNAFISIGFKLFEPEKPWGLPESLYWRKKL